MNASANAKSEAKKRTTPAQPITRTQAWIMAARPKTLPAAISPVLVGSSLAMADGVFAWLPALACLVAALLLQIGSNLANDYFDFVKGADTAARLGPTRVTASGLLPPDHVRSGMWVVFGMAALVGLYLVYVGGWPILAIGVAAIVAALAYTGGPKPFGYFGLGDLFVFLFFGPVAVGGTYFVQSGFLTPATWIASIPMGALITNILVVNNLRDIETDRAAGKMTLAVRLGRRGAQVEYMTLLGVAYLAAIVLWAGGGSIWLLATLITLPRAGIMVGIILHTTDGPRLNEALAGTARLALLFAMALSIGFLAERDPNEVASTLISLF